MSRPARQGPLEGLIWEDAPRPPEVRLVNGLGRALARAGVRWPRLDPDAMRTAASRKTGLTDFGDDAFRDGLGALVGAFETANSAHPFGRLFFRQFCVSLLANRLKTVADLARHPEIRAVPLKRPLFIAGLPRSGTTFLHRLASEDPSARPLRFWEAFGPSPPPESSTYATDPRIARAGKALSYLYRLSPKLEVAHECGPQSPEEDNNLFAQNFSAAIFGFMFDVPDYLRWLNDRPPEALAANYRYVKTQLQLLSWKCPGGHWALKSPAHLFSLDALLDVFPDARVIQTHRDPSDVMPSLCSLAAAVRAVTTEHLDPHRLGAEFLEAMPVGPERAIAARAAVNDPSRFFDVAYPDLLADPIGTLRAIYEHFGDPFPDEFAARARRWLASNPQHKRGVHRYALADFGLTAREVERAFAPYLAWLAEHMPGVASSAAGLTR